MILNFLKGFSANGGTRKPTNFEEKIKKGIKLHTIRIDGGNRWKPGRKIHFSTGARTGRYNCFKEGVCSSVQHISIKDRDIWVDGKRLPVDMITWLAINDGFDNIEDFWAWFDQYSPFEGKIIHWSENLSYD